MTKIVKTYKGCMSCLWLGCQKCKIEPYVSIDVWDEKYTADPAYECDGEVGKIETYGSEYQKALELHKKAPGRIWTMIDGENGFYVVAGMYFVNRIHYLVTLEEWESEDEEYKCDNFEDDDCA